MHERLDELAVEREAVQRDRVRVAVRLDRVRAEVADRQRSLAALAKLDLPPPSVVFQLGMAGSLFNMGTWLAREGHPAVGVLAAMMVLAPVAVALLMFRRERRLLAAISAGIPSPTRVAEDLLTDDDALPADATARRRHR